MRIYIMAVLALAVCYGSSASANTWRAKAALDPSSPSVCTQADVSHVVLSFREEGDQLAVETAQKEVYYAPISTDGTVKGPITVAVGSRRFAAELVGQIRSREITVTDLRFSCRFLLVPVP
jgi:hypothetical protein